MIQVQRGKNATTTEYVIREMQTMAATCLARHAGQGLAMKTKAVAWRFWRAPGLARVDACAIGRRRDASKEPVASRCAAEGFAGVGGTVVTSGLTVTVYSILCFVVGRMTTFIRVLQREAF